MNDEQLYSIIKIHKETGDVIGVLSRGKRRWLPIGSNKKVYARYKDATENELKLINSKYTWQSSHAYRYELIKI